MKKLLLLFILCYSSAAFAQDSVKYFNTQRNRIKTTGMTVLGSWGAANIVAGVIGYNNSDGSTRYFHQMNAIWGAVNLVVSASGYIGTEKDKGKTLTAAQSLADQKKIEKIFLINGALDVVYIGAGTYLNIRGNTDNNNKLTGYGSSIILQGAFLLLFDPTMYTSERNNGNKLRSFLQRNPVIFNGQKVGMLIRF